MLSVELYELFSSSELASVCLGTGRKIAQKIDVVDIVIITNKQRCLSSFSIMRINRLKINRL